MLLREMFSPVGGPKSNEEPGIDWLDDLKFFINNDNDMLTKNMFPAIKKHEQYVGHPDAYKLYVKPVERCLEQYCNQFDVDKREEKFPKEELIELAKKFAEEQNKIIERGDYEN